MMAGKLNVLVLSSFIGHIPRKNSANIPLAFRMTKTEQWKKVFEKDDVIVSEIRLKRV